MVFKEKVEQVVIMSDREEKFEKMLQSIKDQYADTEDKMKKLKAEGKTKTVTYKQLMTNKLTLGNMLALYKIYDLID